MGERLNKKFDLDNPTIVLNRDIEDKTILTKEKSIELLRKKTNRLKSKNLLNKEEISYNKKNCKLRKNCENSDNGSRPIILSEDSETGIKPIKNSNELKSLLKKSEKLKKINHFSKSSSNKAEEINTDVPNEKKSIIEEKIIKKKKNIIEDDILFDNFEIDSKSFEYKFMEVFNKKPGIKLEKYNNYEKIVSSKNCKYVEIFNNISELKTEIENINFEVSACFKNNKKKYAKNIRNGNTNKDIDNIEKEEINVIYSEEGEKKNLFNQLMEIFSKKKYNTHAIETKELFNKLLPYDTNNLLNYLPMDYSGINKIGYLDIISNSKQKLNYITPYFNEYQTINNIQNFHKYILNLSPYNNSNGYIYHIIFPKSSLKTIEFENDEVNLKYLSEINVLYYFYVQKPGELLIIEPDYMDLAFYEKAEVTQNILLMYWNKMDINSVRDYLKLKEICESNKFKEIPILNMLLNFINSNLNNLSGDILKTIKEIFDSFNEYENINKYSIEIFEKNIFLHELYSKNILQCNKCHQEIFNYYLYCNEEINPSESDNYICINCAFNNPNYLNSHFIFFKYTSDDIKLLISAITSAIANSNNNINNKNNNIISKSFDFKNREDDKINYQNLLGINGPFKNVDKNENNEYNVYGKPIFIDKFSFNFFKSDEIDDPLDKKYFGLNYDDEKVINENSVDISKLKFESPKVIGFFNDNDINNRVSEIIKKSINSRKSSDNKFGTYKNNTSISVDRESNKSKSKVSKKYNKKVSNIQDLLDLGMF